MHIPFKLLYKVARSYSYKITFARVWNLLLIGLSMGLSKSFRKPVVWGKPCLLMVEPTNLCNLRCPMCPSGAGEMTRPQGMMELEPYKQVIDTLGKHLILIQFWNQGEPFLNKNFTEMAAYAKSKGIPAMTSTNGHFLKDQDTAEAIVRSGLDEMLISVDGLDQESYAKYRVGGNLAAVLDGVKLLAKTKKELDSKTPLINLQFLVFKHNQHQMDEMLALGRTLNADIVTFKSAQIYSDQQADEFLPDSETFRRYQKSEKKYLLKGSLPDWCGFLWYGSVLNWNGDVAPCCFDKNGHIEYGSAFETTDYIQTIWRGETATFFRKKILERRKAIPICNNCFEGLSQSYVDYHVL